MVKNSGLGKGLDSLIPNISSDVDSEEPLSLEDILNKDSQKSEKDEIFDSEESIVEKEDTSINSDKLDIDSVDSVTDINDVDDVVEELIPDNEIVNDTKSDTKSIDENSEETEESQLEDLEDSNLSEDLIEDINSKSDLEVKDSDNIINNGTDSANGNILDTENSNVNIKEETIDNIESNDNSIRNIIDESKENDVDVLLSKKEEQNLCQVIEIVEKNPRITLWSAKSAAVLRYLRKTEPEFSISNEASKLIEEAIAKKYPEIWTLFDHL